MMKTIATLLSASLLSACALDDGTGLGDHEAEPEAEVSGVTRLASVTIPDGAELEFGVLDSGGITVSELVPTGAISPMNALMSGENATPLELFLAVAPPELAVPEELEVAHVEWARANDADPVPRALSLDDRRHAEYRWLYAADCDLPDDGAWFNNFWQTYNWSWHWYWRTSAIESSSATTPRRNAVQSHVCNDGPKGTKVHRVRRSSCYTGAGWRYVHTRDTRPEYRSQFRIWNDPYSCYYRNNVVTKTEHPDPTYSHGITTP